MTATRDQKIFFTALGFMAVILGDVPKDRQAQRALAIAQLIENFCMSAVGDETGPSGHKSDLFAGLVNDNRKNRDAAQEAMATLHECLGEAAAAPAEQAHPLLS